MHAVDQVHDCSGCEYRLLECFGFHWSRVYSNVRFSFRKSVKLSSLLPLLCISLQTLSKIPGAETVREKRKQLPTEDEQQVKYKLPMCVEWIVLSLTLAFVITC